MSIVVSTQARIRGIKVSDAEITAHLRDGRVISVPLAWSWRLSEATPAQRANFKIIGDGQGVHWPDVDEDISAEGMLHGISARRPRRTLQHLGAPRQPDGEPPSKKRLLPAREKRRAPLGRRAAGGGRAS